MTTFFGRNSPHDGAIANFKCALDEARLLSTPADEITLAKSKAPRGSYGGLSTVYVIGNAANSLLKIGYADNLKSRFCGLNTGSPVALSLLHFLHVVDGAIAKRIEGDVHRRLAEHRTKGEWFDVSLSVAAETISAVMRENRFRWWTEEESRRLAAFARESFARYEERQRLYGT